MKVASNLFYIIPILLLIIGDLIFIGLEPGHLTEIKLSQLQNGNNHITQFQQLKWLIAAMALVIIAMLRKDKKYFTWVLMFLFLFVEETFQIHKYLGSFFYNAFGMSTGSKGTKIMELFAALFLGFIFLAPALEAYKKSDSFFKQLSKRLFILLALFLFFVGILNPIYQWTAMEYNSKIELAIRAGTLVSASLLTGYIIGFALQTKKI